MADHATMWIRWRPGRDDESPWEEVQVRSVSVRAAFAFSSDPPPPGTRGIFEVRDERGNVQRRGVCRVVFVREGVGAGLELRRGVIPADRGSVSTEPTPPSSHFKRPGSERSVRERQDPSPTYDERHEPPASPLPDERFETDEAPSSSTRDRSPVPPRPSFGPPADAPRIDSVFPSPRPPTAADSGLPPLDVPEPELDDLDLELPVEPVAAPPTPAAPDHGQPLPSWARDLDLDLPSEPPSPAEPGPQRSVPDFDLPDLDGPLEPRPPFVEGAADGLPGIDDALPSFDDALPSFDDALPPDGAASFGLPDLEPPARADPPEPEFETYEAHVSASEPPPRASSVPPPPEDEDAPTVATVPTRTRGRGATEGFAIGIDLGTSNTCASVVLRGNPEVIPTRYGAQTVPSVYARVGHRILVGEPAVKRMILDPRETIYGSKRLIGRAFTEELAFDYQPYFAYQLAETRDHRFGAAIDNDVVSFEEVATALLEEVRDVASRYLGGPIDRAVITVPAYFTEAQREAVKRAARAARLMVDQLVPEPTAAALAYGYNQTKRGNYVVFDLGGGTFDVSVMRAHQGEFQVLAIGGDPFLGGIDVDDMIANYMLEELHRELRVRIDPTSQQLARLREVAEECKRGLSVQETFAVSLKHFTMHEGKPVDLNVTVSRRLLEDLAGPFVDRLIEITQETVAAAGLEPHDAHELLLVGGMSRMPLVHTRVEELFHRRADRRISPDEAVAIGAALLASRIREVRLIDVLPLSIGIAGEGRRFLRLVPRNTPLPASKSFVVHTERDLQTRYELPLYQGERRDATQNEYLGTLIIEGLAAREAGRAIDVELELDDQAVLSVTARDGVTGAALRVHLSREQSATEAGREHDAWKGEAEQPQRLGSPLGRFFERVRGLFG